MQIDWEALIIIATSLAAALSFVAFCYPFLQKNEKQDRYRSVIEKKRQDLYEQAKEKLNKKDNKKISAKDSMAMFYKVQNLAGDFGEKVRTQLLQAGIRDPKAPLIFILAQLLMPIGFVLLAILFFAGVDKEFSGSVKALIVLVAAIAGFYLPKVLIKNQAIKREEELNLTFPDALDMMLICIQGGISIEQTINKVAGEISEHSPVLAEELGILSAEMAMLNDRRSALSDFGKRVGGYGKSFSTTLIQAEQYGTSMSQALRVISNELRDIRMSKAEEKAMSLPPKLTVPMILFFLPALFIVILGPAGIEASGLK